MDTNNRAAVAATTRTESRGVRRGPVGSGAPRKGARVATIVGSFTIDDAWELLLSEQEELQEAAPWS